jgi:hypothetical protein
MKNTPIKGSCLCGRITFVITAESDSVTHCHCKMCQKQHGAAFATYARFQRNKLHYTTGEELLVIYNSSNDVLRKFCRECGSNIEWSCSKRNPERVGIAVGALDSIFSAKGIKQLHLESKADWAD